MERPVIFLDLDDTMFTSVRYRPLEAVRVGAVDSQGRMSSYVTADQAALFEWMNASADIVATTGRGLDAFRRVALPLEGWAICMHGAVILEPSGHISAAWEAEMAAGCQVAGSTLDDLKAAYLGCPAPLPTCVHRPSAPLRAEGRAYLPQIPSQPLPAPGVLV